MCIENSTREKKMNKIFNIIGMLIGVVIILLGILFVNDCSLLSYNGSETSHYTFGGDYYTEQYNVTENVADNVLALGNYFENVFEDFAETIGIFIALFGGVVFCYFGSKLVEEQKKATNVGQPIVVKQETVSDIAHELPEL